MKLHHLAFGRMPNHPRRVVGPDATLVMNLAVHHPFE